ncbi:hypothetical protein ABZS76_21630 [Streptomyces sp. NPDC005562]|uniref:hypothetical protein n=1 Tax=unclassified Streptomyces TaxID=2593676 RepID=UPI0033A2C462
MEASWAGRRAVLVVGAVVGVLLAVLTAFVPDLVPYAAAHPPPRRPVTTVDETSRAGSRPGEGRERPGQVRPPLTDLPQVPRAPYTPPPRPAKPEPLPVTLRDTASQPTERPLVGPVLPNLRVLPLGGGLLLIGLGLGFLGLRLRRG